MDRFRMKTHEDLLQAACELIESTWFSELSMDSVRLRKFEGELRPMHDALPKNEHGTLEPAAVRYTLSDFVHNEAVTDVMSLYSIFKLSTTTPARRVDTESVIKASIFATET